MKPRRRLVSRRSSVAQIDQFTLMDELLASPSNPSPPGYHDARIKAARLAVEGLAVPERSSVTAWSLCCMVGNVLETMLKQGLASDPDGLLQDAFDRLRAAAEAASVPGSVVCLSPGDHAVVAAMVEDWAEILLAAPARDVIRAFRATDRRIRELEAGRAQPHDFTVTTGSSPAPEARL